MSTSLLVTISAGIVLCLLVILFRIEAARGRALFAEGLRAWCDRRLLALYSTLERVAAYLGAGTVRVWVHYGVHTLLKQCRVVLQRLETWLARLQRRNKAAVKDIIRGEGVTAESHLGSIAEHKAATSLTEAQKRKLKEKGLEG